MSELSDEELGRALSGYAPGSGTHRIAVSLKHCRESIKRLTAERAALAPRIAWLHAILTGVVAGGYVPSWICQHIEKQLADTASAATTHDRRVTIAAMERCARMIEQIGVDVSTAVSPDEVVELTGRRIVAAIRAAIAAEKEKA